MKHFIITIFLSHFLLTVFAQNDVSIQASDIEVDSGDTITYPITVDPNGNSVGTLSFGIEYDSNLFEILNLEYPDGWTVFDNINTPGIITFTGFNFNGQNTTFQAANITFDVIGQAGQTGQIQLNVEIVSDSNGQPLNYQSSNGSISITGCAGMPCDDNDDCTINDIYDSNCECAGTFQDTDGDGVCDADDQCPGQDDNLIGTACNDNDDCTVNDIYNSSCFIGTSHYISALYKKFKT